MIILALDSTAEAAAVALCDDDKLICSYLVNNGNTHSRTLLPMIESIMEQASLTIADIDIFACSAGPGSFTGVRIGAATIKGLAFASGKPCVGVSTLEALAYNLSGIKKDAIVCPVMNARRSQVYNAIFSLKDGDLERLTPDRAITIAELDEDLQKKNPLGCDVFLCGDGYDITLKELSKTIPSKTFEPLKYQSGYSVAMCALKKYKNAGAGANTIDENAKPASADSDFSDIALSPTYLRPSQAERLRTENMLKKDDN